MVPFRLLAYLLFCFAASLLRAEPVVAPQADARRLEILFLGAPTANGPHHDPISRYRVLKKALGVAGINLTYSESLGEAFRPEFLQQFDAVLLYANWPTLAPDQEKVLLDYIAGGGGFLPIHCASACFGNSDAFIQLVGARFKRHGGEVFAPTTLPVDHPILKGLGKLEAWDETYQHDRHNDDRTVLQVRRSPEGDEPWTWVRMHGKGRVFYTASGHDHRVWDLPEYHALLRNAIYWAVGDSALAKLTRLQLPALPQQEVLLPGYKLHKAITQAQVALSPQDSAKLIQVPPGFEVSLFASEPNITNPIFVAWDHRGRAFVIETIDYPNNLQDGNLGHDRIKICEDTDGDGRADKFTVFADKLSIPTSLVFANGGVICTNGTELLFLKDTNGDDVADVREKLMTGFSMGDTHAGPSNLRYGFDNRIWATIGYSGFEGEVDGTKYKFAQGLFRFNADGHHLEYLQATTNNTWGLGFTEEFSILGSTANGNPSWVYTLPNERFQAFGMTTLRTPRADNNPLFFPSSMDIRQVDVHDGYTAGAGHAFYTATRFPADYRNRVAFVTEPTGKLVGTFDVTVNGPSFLSRQRPNNIFNSADAWTSPVCAETGPDGALWICDWYNLIVQHNPTPTVASAGYDATKGKGNAYETPLRDKDYGRIWRVYPKGSTNDQAPRLDPANADTLVAALRHPNLFWRLQAQRLLVEGKHRSAAPKLLPLVASNGIEAVHAFQALAGLGLADTALVKSALRSPQFAVRRAAVELSSQANPTELSDYFLKEVSATLPSGGAREWLELFGALSRVPASTAIGQKIYQLAAAHADLIPTDAILTAGWQLAARAHADGVIAAALTANLSPDKLDQSLAGQVVQLIAWAAGTSAERRAALLATVQPRDGAFAKYLASTLAAPAKTDTPALKFAPDAETHRRGAKVYTNICVACHGIDAKGVPGVFPPLAGSEWALNAPDVPVRIVLHGLMGPIKVGDTVYTNAMPGLSMLTSAEIADVITYVRQNFGNDAAPVTEAEVNTIRRQYSSRQEMWKAEELRPAK